MKILHILRSEPDGNVEKFMDDISIGDESKVQALYNGDINMLFFSRNQVPCTVKQHKGC